MFFRNRDIISGEELVECKIVSKETKKILNNLKKLRKLNNIYYLWDYDDKFKKLIYEYKYNRKKILAKFISESIKKEFYFILKKEKIDIIVSVPVSKKRKSERGYNQVDEILNYLEIKYCQIKRTKNTKKMASILDEQKRMKNIKGAFEISDNIDFGNKNILIVDDIVTTGATLKEIKKEILQNSKMLNINIVVFCLAAAKEIKKSKGAI
ncbi:amidophosphoribosyltransferase [Leptotrichia sp. oral taxon 847]|nr:amidophosphoribosyltransferase [Leptotrichia sp. oral taxon 847]